MNTRQFRWRNLIVIILAVFIAGMWARPSFEPPRVLMVALEGASLDVIKPLIKEGKLPHIARLMKNGTCVLLHTDPNSYSDTTWTSIATGKPPAEHGITKAFMLEPKTRDFVRPRSDLRKARALWNMLSFNRKSVGVVSFPATFPAEKINGVMLAAGQRDINTIDYEEHEYSWPLLSSLCEEEEFDNFRINDEDVFKWVKREDFPYFWFGAADGDHFTSALAEYILRRRKFDFMCVYLNGIDIISHFFWKYAFIQDKDRFSEQSIYKELITGYYIRVDRLVGDFLRLHGEDSAVFLVSDHGFMNGKKEVYFFDKVDDILRDCGILKIKEGKNTLALINDPRDPYYFAKHIRIMGNGSKAEFNSAREHAEKALAGITVVETGQPFFEQIEYTLSGLLLRASRKSENLTYHIRIKNKVYPIMDFLVSNNKAMPFYHNGAGFMIMSGRHIKPVKNHIDITPYDVAPTILYYMGLAVGQDMNGRVLLEAFDKAYTHSHPVRYIASYEPLH